MVPFNKTLMHCMLKVPVDIWKDKCFYLFVLNIPLIVVALTVGVVFAIFIDGIVFANDST